MTRIQAGKAVDADRPRRWGRRAAVLSTPKMARGTSGSLTRTMIRNIMLISASAVTHHEQQHAQPGAAGSSGSGMPAMSEPTVISTSAGDDRLDRAGQVEAQDQLELA